MDSLDRSGNTGRHEDARSSLRCVRFYVRNSDGCRILYVFALLLTAAVDVAALDTPAHQPLLSIAESSQLTEDDRSLISSESGRSQIPWSAYDNLFQGHQHDSLLHREFTQTSFPVSSDEGPTIVLDRQQSPANSRSNWEQELAAPPICDVQAVFSTYRSGSTTDCDDWYVLPAGLLYRSYLAGAKEPRIQWTNLYDTRSDRRVWETVLGGRAGLLRYGSPEATAAEAFQLDLEGAVFARVLPDEPSAMLEAADFRFGFLGTWRMHRTSLKAGYYHVSSHVGDEFLLANPLFDRINYVRDSLIVGAMYDLTEDTQIYGEIGNAVGAQGGAKPLELQFGAQYTPAGTTMTSRWGGAPFAAINGHLLQDFDFGGSINLVSGWSWQGAESKSRFRIGLQYYRGPSLQYSFFDRRENLIGGGLWFDF